MPEEQLEAIKTLVDDLLEGHKPLSANATAAHAGLTLEHVLILVRDPAGRTQPGIIVRLMEYRVSPASPGRRLGVRLRDSSRTNIEGVVLLRTPVDPDNKSRHFVEVIAKG